ncbi:hypothetical protein BD779DRAFT_1002582 [Infundibulicybe gibba]|nr:hypothetical protein BD779DRAFT_1002582 [Infundibulicybe gibba]
MFDKSMGDAIPPEILSDIFLYFLSDAIGPDLVEASLRLTHTCRSWRAAALSTPRIWSRFYLVISEENAHSESALLSAWIARSGAHPLQIHLMWDDPPFNSHHPILEILARCSERWEDILLYLPALAFGNGPLTIARGNMPQLTRLGVGASDEVEHIGSSWDVFSIAPKLTSFQSVDCDPTSFRIPWEQLTHIPAMSIGIGKSIQVLRLTPRLHEVTFYHYDHSDSHPYPVVLHKSLKTLFLGRAPNPGKIDYGGFYLNATFPNLQSLTVRPAAFAIAPTIFTAFLSRITALDHLSLRGFVINDDVLLRSLEVAQSLTYLDIHDVLIVGEDNFLARLKSRIDGDGGPGDFALVPKLKILAIQISDSGPELFTELVEHRAGILQKVYLQTGQQLDPHLRDRLEKVQSETLSINVTITA